MKNIMQRTGSESWPSKKDIVQRTSRFSRPVEKDGMKTTGNDLPAAREPTVNRTRSTSQITADNTVKPTEEFERTMVDVSELFLLLLENRLGRTIICAADESGAMRFAMFV